MPRRPHLLLIPLAALIATLPILLHGPSCGHDFDFHLLNFLEARRQLAHGTWPRWAYTPAWGAGEPRFLFYPPLSWLLGALLTTVLPFTLVPAAYTFLALTAAGFAAHRLIRPYCSPAIATLCSTLYLANPYTLFTAYERTAYAELLAAAFMPLLLAAILTPRPRIPQIALPLAALWLTNAPAAVLSTYALALLTVLRLALPASREPHVGPPETWEASETSPSTQQKPSRAPCIAPFAMSGATQDLPPTCPAATKPQLTRTVLLATPLGLALAAFYILPAALERPFVAIQMAVTEGMAPSDNTLFHHTGTSPDQIFHDQVLHTASVIAVLLLATTLLTLLLASLREKEAVILSKAKDPAALHPAETSRTFPPQSSGHILPTLALLTAIIALLLTPASLPLWRHLPELAFLQFPWRLLALAAPVLALSTALALRHLTLRLKPLIVLSLALAVALTLPAWHSFQQSCDPEDTPTGRLAQFRSPRGTEPTDEYTPTDADPEALKPGDPPYWLASNPNAAPPANLPPGQAPDHLALSITQPAFLILNRRAFPAWTLTLNGQPAYPLPSERADGLLALALPTGSDHLDFTWHHSPAELSGDALTLLAALILLALALRPALDKSRLQRRPL